MAWWWTGNIVWLAVIIPVVLVILERLWRVVAEIKRYGDDVLEHGVLLIAAMDNVDELLVTRDAVARVKSGVLRYGKALDKIL